MTTVGPGSTRSTRDGTVGSLLRGWRERRRISQLELALRAESSARHISFIETGRARPSQAMVLRLAEHLEVPVRERNALLIAAGYAPVYTERPLHDPAMAALRSQLDSLLTAYEPNPALVVDGSYDVVAANSGTALLLRGVPDHLLRPPMNALRLSLHPQGLAPRIHNLREWRAHLLERLERQLALRPSVSLRELHEEVSAYPVPGGDPDGRQPAGDAYAYALPLRVELDGRVLSFISTLTTFNTPMDVTVSELAVETLLPADPETAQALRVIAAGAAARPSHPGDA
ncbi:helix-turn-helix transcriptional regulator [Streptomyces sp. NPDC002734]|uniref:helix-turn-helix domain-containing protein n=1 Tax=Streptomyces sp. NPDC002734 TaxID=3154426 RepID=UPI003324FBE0